MHDDNTLHIIAGTKKHAETWALENSINPAHIKYCKQPSDLTGARLVVTLANMGTKDFHPTGSQSTWWDNMAAKLRTLEKQPGYRRWFKQDGAEVLDHIINTSNWRVRLIGWDRASSIKSKLNAELGALSRFVYEYEPEGDGAGLWRTTLLAAIRQAEDNHRKVLVEHFGIQLTELWARITKMDRTTKVLNEQLNDALTRFREQQGRADKAHQLADMCDAERTKVTQQLQQLVSVIKGKPYTGHDADALTIIGAYVRKMEGRHNCNPVAIQPMARVDDNDVMQQYLRDEFMKGSRVSVAFGSGFKVQPQLWGVDLIRAERDRQIEKEGFGSDRDDKYDGELASAAVCYAMNDRQRHSLDHLYTDRSDVPNYWPWASHWWKPSPDDRIRELTKAGALIAAEIDRLRRIELVEATKKGLQSGHVRPHGMSFDQPVETVGTWANKWSDTEYKGPKGKQRPVEFRGVFDPMGEDKPRPDTEAHKPQTIGGYPATHVHIDEPPQPPPMTSTVSDEPYIELPDFLKADKAPMPDGWAHEQQVPSWLVWLIIVLSFIVWAAIKWA